MNNFAIFGDCVTQGMFKKFSHTRAIGLTSILSVVSQPLPEAEIIQEEILKSDLSNYRKRAFLCDINKETINYLMEEKADYLVLDVTDCRNAVLGAYDLNKKDDINDVRCITANGFWNLLSSQFRNEFLNHYSYKVWYPTELKEELYFSAVYKFAELVKKYYESDRIIINRHFFADDLVENGQLIPFTVNSDRVLNLTFNTKNLVDSLFYLLKEQLPGCHVIEWPRNVLGVIPHVFGWSPLHYHPVCAAFGDECAEYFASVSKKEISDSIDAGLNAIGEAIFMENKRNLYTIKLDLLRGKLAQKEELKRIEQKQDVRNACQISILQNDWRKVGEELKYIKDIELYLECLNLIKTNVVIIMGVGQTVGEYISDKSFSLIRKLGFESIQREQGVMYAGLIYKDEKIEDTRGLKSKNVDRTLENNNTTFRIESNSFRPGKKVCSIKINGEEFAVNRRGINIVVFDPEENIVIDSIGFDSQQMVYRFIRGDKVYKGSIETE